MKTFETRGYWRTATLPVAALMLAAAPVAHGQDAKAAAAKASKAVAAPTVSAADKRAAQADLEALIKAAKAEGEVVFYAAPTENVNKRVGEAFLKKYGVRYSFIRAGSTQLEQRYSTEAEAGNIAADMMVNAGGAPAFVEMANKKGWTESVSQVGLPVIKSGEFPARFVTGPTAIVSISPWLIAYHTSSVKGSDVPKDWPDLLDAKWKGRILLSNPSVSDAYVDFWGLLYDKYGDSFFTLLKPNLRPVGTGVQASQGLGAGEGSFLVPAVVAQVMEPKSKGAPLDMVTLPFTTGVEQHIVLTLRSKARHPNAARLFANFAMSQEGNKIFNDDPGGFTIYEPSKLPKEYQSPKPGAAARREAITKLLGF